MDEQFLQDGELPEFTSVTIETVLANLFETVAVTQAQNDVLLGMVTQLLSAAEDKDQEEVINQAREHFQLHHERRIEEMKSQYSFFGGDS